MMAWYSRLGIVLMSIMFASFAVAQSRNPSLWTQRQAETEARKMASFTRASLKARIAMNEEYLAEQQNRRAVINEMLAGQRSEVMLSDAELQSKVLLDRVEVLKVPSDVRAGIVVQWTLDAQEAFRVLSTKWAIPELLPLSELMSVDFDTKANREHAVEAVITRYHTLIAALDTSFSSAKRALAEDKKELEFVEKQISAKEVTGGAIIGAPWGS